MTENNPQIIKTITPQSCPHCGAQIFINQYMVQPSVLGVLTAQEISEAKTTVRVEIGSVKFKSQQEYDSFIEWLEDPNTLFAPDDVKSIVDEVKTLQAK